MALFPCPECGNMVSDKAFHCPKCGYPLMECAQQRTSENDTQDAGELEEKTNPRKQLPTKWVMVAAIILAVGVTAVVYLIPELKGEKPTFYRGAPYTVVRPI